MSIAGLVLLVGCFIGLLAVIAAPIVLALFIVGLAVRVVLFVLFLPFRLLGGLFGLLRGAVLLGGLGFLFLLGLLPLLPFLLIALGVYLVFRAMRPRATPVARA